MRPNFGCIVHDLLMNPEDSFTEEEIKEDIIRIVDREPRVRLNDIILYSSDHAIRIELHLDFVVLESQDVLYLEFTRDS